MAAFRTTRRYHCRTSHTSLRISFGAGSPGLDIVELELYQVAVGISHVKGFSHPSGAYDVLRGAFDLHARFLEEFGQCIRIRTFDHQGEVIVTSGGDSLEGGIRPQMQDEPRRHPQRDEGMLSAFILVEAERLETQDVAIESQRPLDVPYPPVGVICIGNLHRLSESFRSEPRTSGRSISLRQGHLRPAELLQPHRFHNRSPPLGSFCVEPDSPFTGARSGGSSGWASSSRSSLGTTMAARARKPGTIPATKTVVSTKAAPARPAIAMETGIRASETKKSRLDTRPRRPSGTRRWSRVPQITIAAEWVAPTAGRAVTSESSV